MSLLLLIQGAPPGSSGGGVPGTGMRPGTIIFNDINTIINTTTIIGSGRKVPGTARLRTGIQPAGPGTQVSRLTIYVLNLLMILII